MRTIGKCNNSQALTTGINSILLSIRAQYSRRTRVWKISTLYQCMGRSFTNSTQKQRQLLRPLNYLEIAAGNHIFYLSVNESCCVILIFAIDICTIYIYVFWSLTFWNHHKDVLHSSSVADPPTFHRTRNALIEIQNIHFYNQSACKHIVWNNNNLIKSNVKYKWRDNIQ